MDDANWCKRDPIFWSMVLNLRSFSKFSANYYLSMAQQFHNETRQ